MTSRNSNICTLLAGVVAFTLPMRGETAPKSGLLCDQHLSAIVRAVPEPKYADLTLKDTQNAINRLATAVALDHDAQVAQDAAGAQGQYPASSPLYETGDGRRIRYRHGSGDERNARIRPEDYRALRQRISATWEHLGTIRRENKSAATFQLSDTHAIKEFLETLNRIKNPERERERFHVRGMKCLISGGIAGIFLGLGVAAFNDPNKALAQVVLEKAKKTTVHSKEKHFELIEKMLGLHATSKTVPREWEREKLEIVLKRHRDEIEAMERYGTPVEYGARESDYIYPGYTPDTDDLRKLSEKNWKLTPRTLDEEASLYLRKDPDLSGIKREHYTDNPFNDYELSEYLEGRIGTAGLVAVVAGEALGGGGLMGLAGYLACGRAGGKAVALAKDFIRPNRRVLPDGLDDFRTAVDSTLANVGKNVTGGTVEILWDGSQTTNGQHSDFILEIDRAQNPPKMTLTGVSYQMPVDYYKRLSDAELEAMTSKVPTLKMKPPFPDPKTIRLGSYETQFIAERFPLVFAKPELAQIRKVFLKAKRLKLNPDEMFIFLTELQEVHELSQLKMVESVLADIKDARNKESK